MVELDVGAVEARFLRLCSRADLFGSSGLLVLDLDSPVVRSASFSNKHRQGWSLSRHMAAHVDSQDGFHGALSSKQIDSFEPPLQQAPAEPVPLKPGTVDFLTSVGLAPHENFAQTHCWRAAISSHIRVDPLTAMLLAVDAAQARLGLSLHAAYSLLSPTANCNPCHSSSR